MFRFVTVLMTGLLLVTQLIPVATAGAPLVIPDTLEELLVRLHKLEIITDAQVFRPSESLNRAEALSLVLRASGVDIIPVGNMFHEWKDVPQDAWYNQQVLFATQLGIITPQQNQLFHPDRPVTTGEFLTFLHRMHRLVTKESGCCEGVENSYQDLKPWDWFFEAAVWARNNF